MSGLPSPEDASLPWYRRPVVWLAACGLLSLVAVAGLVDLRTGAVKLRLEPALDKLLPRHHESREAYDALRDRFGNDDALVLVSDRDVFADPDHLRDLGRLSERLASLDGVSRVHSLANTPALAGSDEDVTLAALLAEVPEEPGELDALALRAARHPLVSGRLISRGGGRAAVVVELEAMDDEAFLERGLDRMVLEAAREEIRTGDIWLAGTPVVKAEMSRILVRDMATVIPAILVLMTVIAALVFRSVIGTWAPVACIAVAELWTLGVMGWSGHALNVITTIVPPLVLIVGFAYAVHLLSAYHRLEATEDPALRAWRALRHVAFPVLLTGVTTIAGFLSLATSHLEVIQEFGRFAAVGVAATQLATLLFLPAVLGLARPTRPTARLRTREVFDRLAERTGRFAVGRRRTIVALGLVAGIAALALATRVRVDTEIIENFAPEAPIRTSYEAINDALDGANPFTIAIEAETPGAFAEPAALRELVRLQDWLESQPEIGGTTSVADHVQLLHQAFSGGGADALRVPDSKALVSQLLLVGAGEEIDRLLDAPHTHATVEVRSRVTRSAALSALASRIERRLGELPAGFTGRVTGNALLVSRAADEISAGQVRSLAAAFVAIGAILCAYFRSVGIGLLALIPNALPIAIYFGALGAFGITLNNATALMGCVVLGIAVDDTIHFLVRFRRGWHEGRSAETSAADALMAVARPVTITTVALCAGLLLLTTSDLRTQAEFGAMGAFALAVAWLVDVLWTPALCASLDGFRREPGPARTAEPEPSPDPLS
ncbi:MAG: efflux RND transporter permease subunit [Proteobacteria bacterium]|nr:efflux RND transporter permease subunit [Pseudomonadota bacterium]